MKLCEIYRDEHFFGYVSSSDDYFFSLKVHALMTESGILAKIFFLMDPVLVSMLFMIFYLPEGSIFYGERAYKAYAVKVTSNSQTFI